MSSDGNGSRGKFEKNRGRGFLTAADKDWLVNRNDEGLSDGAVRKRRERVRDRCQNAIHDFRLLREGFTEDDLRQVFNFRSKGPGHRDTAYEFALFNEGIIEMLAVLYKGLGKELFTERLTEAVARVHAEGSGPRALGAWRQGVTVDIDAAMNVNFGELAENLDSGSIEELSNAEISALLKILYLTGEPMPTTKEDLIEIFEKHWDEVIPAPPEALIEPPEELDEDTDREYTQEELEEALHKANMMATAESEDEEESDDSDSDTE